MRVAKFSALLLGLAVLVFFSSADAEEIGAMKGRILKIGVSTALTGEAATWGQDIRDTLLFANEKLGAGKFKLIIEDDKCRPKDAATIAHKFIDVDKVDFVLGFTCSNAALAALPLYERAKIPVVVVAGSSPRIAQAGDYIFRTTPSDQLAAGRLFQWVKGKEQSIAVISELTDYTQDLKDAFLSFNQDGALKIVTEDYLPDSVDFKAILLRLKAKKPESLFINTQAEATFAIILKQLFELNWKLPIYGAYYPGSPALRAAAKDHLNGVEFVDVAPLSNILTPDGKTLYPEYLKKYGALRSIDSVFASAYEAFRVIAQATAQQGDVRAFLYTTKFNGVFGPFSFDKNGDIEGLSFVMKRIENGNVVTIQ